MRRPHDVFGALVRALRDPRSLADGRPCGDEARLVELAAYHRVSGQLAAAYSAAGLAVPPPLAPVRAALTMHHLRHLQALGRIGHALDAAGIRWLALKGPLLAGIWYRDPAARMYHDLDILVDPAAFAAAIDTLGAGGFVELNRNWCGFRALGMGEVPLADDSVTVDLHWHLLPFARDRRSFSIPTGGVLDRRVAVDLGSVPVWSLADDDMLAHVVLHAGLAGARFLLHLRDVHMVGTRVDTATAAARMRLIGMERLAAATMDRVERLLGPIAAPPMASALHHPAWRTLNGAVDAAWAVINGNTDKPYPSTLLASARATGAATVAEVARQGVTSVRRHTGRRTLTTPGGPLDWEVDAGGGAERDRFLREVEGGAYST
jgi:hypothetical protein